VQGRKTIRSDLQGGGWGEKGRVITNSRGDRKIMPSERIKNLMEGEEN